jgi:hypothetical protein
MTNKYLKATVTLAVTVAVSGIASFAQSSTTTNPALSGAIKVLDGENHVLGTLLGLTPNYQETVPDNFLVFRNGFFVALEFGGFLPVPFTGINWTGRDCTGDAYLYAAASTGARMGRRFVVYSRQSNSLYVPSGTGASAVAVSMDVQSGEVGGTGAEGSSTCLNFSQVVNEPGFLLTSFDAKKLGWSLCGAPLHVKGPVTFKEY